MSPETPETSRAREAAAESSRAREEAAQRDGSGALDRQKECPWVVLSTIPVVVGDNDARAVKIIPGTDLLLDLQDPPRVTYLVVPKRLAMGPRWPPHPLPSVAASEPSARLLFSANQEEGTCDVDYFICDGNSRTAARLPAVPADLGLHLYPRRRSVGLAANPHRIGHFVVAQLHPPSATKYDTLLYFCTAKHEWGKKTLASSPSHKPWGAHGVFVHDGLLWWVDAAYGMLVCDPFLNRPQLRLVPLPAGREMEEPVRSRTLLDKRRLVRPSGGKLRYVEIGTVPDDSPAVDDAQDGPVVSIWTLDDPDNPPHWKQEYTVPLADIWDDSTYIAAGLTPGKVPTLALVDPMDHGVVYFFEEAVLFGVDLRARRVVAWAPECFVDVRNPGDLKFQHSRFVDAWTLPPTFPITASSTDEQSNIIRFNGPNPLGYQRGNGAPTSSEQEGAEPKEERAKLEDAIRCVNLKIYVERSTRLLQKLIRDRRYLKRLLDEMDG